MPAAAIINQQPLLDDDHHTFTGIGRIDAANLPAYVVDIKRTAASRAWYAKPDKTARRAIVSREVYEVFADFHVVAPDGEAMSCSTIVGNAELVLLVGVVGRIKKDVVAHRRRNLIMMLPVARGVATQNCKVLSPPEIEQLFIFVANSIV